MKNGWQFLNMLLTLLLLLVIIFKDKYVYIANSLEVSISIFIYAFSFLIPALIIKTSKFKSAKKAINLSIISVLIFLGIITVMCSIPSMLSSNIINESLRNIFTPNSYLFKGLIIYYPDLKIIGIIIVYALTHRILISIYEALNNYVSDYLSYGISVFIAFIIDTMLMVPVLHINKIYYAKINMIDLIKHLTANFMIVIIMSLLTIVIYSVAVKKEN